MRRLFKKTKNKLRQVRHARVRARIIGTKEIPRLSVFRSLRSMVVQIINDNTGKTLCYVDSKTTGKEKVESKTGKSVAAYLAGKKIAELAKAKKIETVVFDRGGYQYHGRVAAVAEGARAGGLKF